MLIIYQECAHRNDMPAKNCWNCPVLDLCNSCKVLGCDNEEKEETIRCLMNKEK